jgi:hypothetical protein
VVPHKRWVHRSGPVRHPRRRTGHDDLALARRRQFAGRRDAADDEVDALCSHSPLPSVGTSMHSRFCCPPRSFAKGLRMKSTSRSSIALLAWVASKVSFECANMANLLLAHGCAVESLPTPVTWAATTSTACSWNMARISMKWYEFEYLAGERAPGVSPCCGRGRRRPTHVRVASHPLVWHDERGSHAHVGLVSGCGRATVRHSCLQWSAKTPRSSRLFSTVGRSHID